MFPPTAQEGFLVSTPSPAFIIRRSFIVGCSDWCEVILLCSFDSCFSNSDAEHLLMAIDMSPL